MPRLRKRLGAMRDAARNARDLLRHGRLGAPYTAGFEVIERGAIHQLRRYAAERTELTGTTEPLLLVPPLMVAADVYDISPELSAVGFLARLGLDVWLVDFGAPEHSEGGLARTLDDHILAVDRAVDTIRATTGKDVHLAGYSQGGMFAYQAAAFRRSQGVASVVTFGSPVDVRKMLPVPVADPVVERVLRWVRAGIDQPLEGLEGLPGTITSTGFKVFAARKEIEQIGTFFRKLHDREALEKREPARRFLGGEGFVAWPGPAFKDFVDRVVVENRMTRGGLLIADRTVSLADITCPILCFVGTRDDMARPPAVRAIRKAAPNAEIHEITLAAGHFGLVVGSRALTISWPTTAEWVAWRSGVGPKPEALDQAAQRKVETAEGDASGLYELSVQALDGVWNRLGSASVEAAGLLHALRWEIPRLSRLESLSATDRVGMGQALAEQARAIPDEVFFLWQGRAATWGQVDRRVDRVVDALAADGVKAGDELRLRLRDHPDDLTVLVAIDRIGAVAVIAGPHAEPTEDELDVDALIARRPKRAAMPRNEALAPDRLMVLTGVPSGTGSSVRDRLVITHRRWATGALVTAGACQLTPRDTMLCALPLHHPLALLVAGGGALVGGSRLAFCDDVDAFWDQIRRTGSTVAVYDGALLRRLARAPRRKGEHQHPLRQLVGSGADAESWRIVRERFGDVRILEFHASVAGAAVLANLEGTKPGSVGRPFPGSAWVMVAREGADGQPLLDARGRVTRCEPDEPGLLLARIEPGRSLGVEHEGDPELEGAPILRGAVEKGDAWVLTGDRMRRDADGDWWRA
ncbi:MAG: AMP-binding protein [Myxococcales bacterium]|nr:AMP-binding protein [Myxococcales bacterium]